MPQNKIGILLSGGMDSMALAYWLRPSFAFTVDYGQKCAQSEIEVSKYVCEKLGIEHHIISVDCSSLGSGTLSGKPSLKDAPSEEWWPYRNQLLVTLAAMKGIALGIKRLIIGTVSTDSERHIDGTKEFFKRLNDVVSLQEGNIEITAPAIDMSTLELIKVSEIPYNMLLHSHSCNTSNQPCMHCSGCYKNFMIRKELGID